MKFSNVLKFCFEAGIAPRPEWSSFCEEARRAKKREWRAEIGAQEDNNFLFDKVKCAP